MQATSGILALELVVHAMLGLLVMAKPHLSEVCFVKVGLFRLAVGLCLGSEVMPMTSALQLWMDNHMEKMFEVVFSGQMRPSIQVPLRVCLVYGYATTYSRLHKPYPWITAILVQLAAAGFQLIISSTLTRHPWQLLGFAKPRQAPAAVDATTPTTTKKPLSCAGPSPKGGFQGEGPLKHYSPASVAAPKRCASTLPNCASIAEEEAHRGRSRMLSEQRRVLEPGKGQSSVLFQQAPVVLSSGTTTQPSPLESQTLGSQKPAPSRAPGGYATTAAASFTAPRQVPTAADASGAAANTETATAAAGAAANTETPSAAGAAGAADNTEAATAAAGAAATPGRPTSATGAAANTETPNAAGVAGAAANTEAATAAAGTAANTVTTTAAAGVAATPGRPIAATEEAANTEAATATAGAAANTVTTTAAAGVAATPGGPTSATGAAANTEAATAAAGAAAKTVTTSPAAGTAASRPHPPFSARTAGQKHAHKADPQTLQQLRRIQRTLQSRQKYVTHFNHHLVSFKVPCQSEPSSLKPGALSGFGSCVRASMSDVEVLSAAMRAGCIILCADIMVGRSSLRESQQQHPSVSAADAAGAAGAVGLGESRQRERGRSQEAEFGRALAAVAQQWLLNMRLADELPPSATLLLQVDGNYFLCRQHAPAATQDDAMCGTAASLEHQKQQLVWDVQGPLPLSMLPHIQPLLPSCTICPTSPSVLLPPLSSGMGSNSSSSSSVLIAAKLSLPACTSDTVASEAVGGHGEGGGGGGGVDALLLSSMHQHGRNAKGRAGPGTEEQGVAAPAAVVVLQIRVQVPQGAEVHGWQEGEGSGASWFSSDVDAGVADVDEGNSGTSHALQLKALACVGSHYLPTSVKRCPVASSSRTSSSQQQPGSSSSQPASCSRNSHQQQDQPPAGGPAAAAAGPAAAVLEPGAHVVHLDAPVEVSGMETLEFDLAIPLRKVQAALGTDDAHALSAGLRLELWHRELLLDSCPVLLVPSSLPGMHAELQQRLPWGRGRPDADSDVSDFLVDVGAWMQRAAAVSPPPGQAAGGGGLLQPLTQQCTDEGPDQQALASAAVAAAAAAAAAAERAVISQREPVLAPSAAAPAPVAPVVGELSGGEQPECLFVEKGVVPQHQDAAVLCGWGVRLLRQAVLWGLPCLATLLVEKLLAMRATSSWEQLVILASGAPGTLSTMPPTPVPDFPSARMDQRNEEDVRQEMEEKEETQEVDVNDLGGLLHLGLLSPCPEQMLRAVMGWGQRWGQASSTSSAGNSSSGKQGARAVCGFGWQWDEPNQLGLTPHQLLVSHADKEALLQVLMEMDPAEWLSEQQALKTAPSQQGNSVKICTQTRDGFEQGAGGQGEATRDGSSGPAIGVLRWYNLRQQLDSLVSSAMGVLSKHRSGKSHRQGQLHDQTEDGVRAVAADPARPGAARRAPAAMTEAPIPPAVIPCKRTLWKAALRSTLFGLGGGKQWVGGFVGPSEQSFMEWASGYTHNMLAARFNFLLLGCVVGVVRSLTSGLLCQSEVLLQYSITSAYFWGILKRRRKDGTRYARYGHIAMWAFLGLGILPMENNTISMVATYSESLVLFALFSPVLEQSSLRALLLERLSTTWVFFLLFNTLGVRAPLLRAVVQNALSAAAELVLIGAHLRYTFLKAWAESRHRQAMQARKDM